MKILLIEDSHLDYTVMYHRLHSYLEFPEITWAIDGGEAVKTLKGQDDFDFILLDLYMPAMNGHEFLKWYDRSYEAHKPVFVISSSRRKDDIESCKQYSYVRKFLNKPFGSAEIDIILDEMGIVQPKQTDSKSFKENSKFLENLFTVRGTAKDTLSLPFKF